MRDSPWPLMVILPVLCGFPCSFSPELVTPSQVVLIFPSQQPVLLRLFISAQICHLSLSVRVMTLGSIGFYSSNFYHARLRKSLIIYSFTFRRTASWKCFICLFSCWLPGQCWQYYKFNLPLQCSEFLCVVKPRKQHCCIGTIGWINLIAFTYNKVRI